MLDKVKVAFLQQTEKAARNKIQRHIKRGETDKEKLFETVMQGVRDNKAYRKIMQFANVDMVFVEDIAKYLIDEELASYGAKK